MREFGVVGVWFVVACSPAPGFSGEFSGGGTASEQGTGTMDASGSDATSVSAGIGDSTGQDDTIKLDVGSLPDPPEPSGGGCQKVDFLFVVDNSVSMTDNQQNLVASVPGFLSTIEDVVEVEDFHLMVVDSDAWSIYSVGAGPSCAPEPECCYALCNDLAPIPIDPPPASCAGTPCSEIAEPSGCEVTLGAGRTLGAEGNACGLAGGLGFMTDQQPDLEAAFSCAALVGNEGHGEERPMEAMVEAVSAQLSAGGCNDGFLRDDALLVVTFITDSDDTHSAGSPQDWRNALIAAKQGREEGVVVLGLIADTGWPGAVCTDDASGERLADFVESFDHGTWASVCEPSYAPFFAEAVGVVDLGCDGFDPAG